MVKLSVESGEKSLKIQNAENGFMLEFFPNRYSEPDLMFITNEEVEDLIEFIQKHKKEEPCQ